MMKFDPTTTLTPTVSSIVRWFLSNFLFWILIFCWNQSNIDMENSPQFERNKLQIEYRQEILRHVEEMHSEEDDPSVRREKTREYLAEYRIVSARRGLVVREKPRKNSRRVGSLLWSTTVRLIKKKKNWSLVEYSYNDGEVVLKGWVFSRHLKKIVK